MLKRILTAVFVSMSVVTGATAADPDTQDVTYTWTGGGGDGKWTTPANWSPSLTPCFGYPDNETYAKAVFNGDATVDLCGESIETAGTDGKGVTIAAGAKVTIKNGKLKWDFTANTGTAVGSGAVLTLENVALTAQRYAANGGDTLVLRGTSSLSGSYRPWNKSSVLEIRDGATTIDKLEGYGGTYNDSRILVFNATLTVNTPGNNMTQGRPYLLQRGGKMVVNGTSGTTSISASTGFFFEGGSFEAPDGLAVNFSGAKEFVVKAADYIPAQELTEKTECTLISTKGMLTLPDLEGKLDVTGLPEYILEARLVNEGNILKLVLTPKDVHEHVWGEWTTNVPPTCVTGGERTHSCTAEGCTEPPATETETLGALGHEFVDGRCVRCGLEVHPDTKPVTYTWTGLGSDNRWSSSANWTPSETPCFGYPDNAEFATAKFVADADVDLCGGEYAVLKLTSENTPKVKLSNGTLSNADKAFVPSGTLELSNAVLEYRGTGNPELKQAHAIILDGNSDFRFYRPWNAPNGTLLVQNGESTVRNIGGYYNGTGSENRWVMVSNAVLTVSGVGSVPDVSVSGYPLVIRNGEDRQGQVKITIPYDVSLTYSRYDFAIPESGLRAPAIEVAKLGKLCSNIGDSEHLAQITVDVSKFQRRSAPLLRYGETSLGEMPAVELTTIPAEAKVERNAKLEWKDNTLYYRQDGLPDPGLMLIFSWEGT